MSRTKPEARTDKNGKLVTRHVRQDNDLAAAARAAATTPTPSARYQTMSYEDIVNNPSAKDVLTASLHMVRSIERIDESRTWEKVMGDDFSRHNHENVVIFERKQLEYLATTRNQEIRDMHDLMLKNESEATSHTRAYLANVPTPYDHTFEALWMGDLDSDSGHMTFRDAQKMLDNLLAQKEAFENGTLSAVDIAGVARDSENRAIIQLASQISAMEEAIRVHGRNIAANIDAVDMAASKGHLVD